MAYNDEVRRIVLKRGAGVPTIPASADHRNGDWISTDIYEGEFYQDTDTGKVYTRQGSTIVNSDGTPLKRVYKAKISQTSTNAPVELNVIQDDFGGTWNYVSAGTYDLDTIGFFTDIDNVCWFVQNSDSTIVYFSASLVSNSFRLQVRDALGLLSNGEITNATILIEESY